MLLVCPRANCQLARMATRLKIMASRKQSPTHIGSDNGAEHISCGTHQGITLVLAYVERQQGIRRNRRPTIRCHTLRSQPQPHRQGFRPQSPFVTGRVTKESPSKHDPPAKLKHRRCRRCHR